MNNVLNFIIDRGYTHDLRTVRTFKHKNGKIKWRAKKKIVYRFGIG